MFISVDPGQTVGVATFKSDGSDYSKQSLSLNDFMTFLIGVQQLALRQKDLQIRFLYEDFTLRQDKAIIQTGSDMPASQCIGMVKLMHRILGDEKSTISKAQSSNLRTALKWAGYPELANKPSSWHCPDELSAYAHGAMWLINLGVRKHPIFES